MIEDTTFVSQGQNIFGRKLLKLKPFPHDGFVALIEFSRCQLNPNEKKKFNK